MTARRATKVRVPGPRADPDSPWQLPRRSLRSAVRRSFVEFDQDNAWDWAAALTYYGVLSIFPGLLVVVSLVGLARPGTIEPLVASVSDLAPGRESDRPALDSSLPTVDRVEPEAHPRRRPDVSTAAMVSFMLGLAAGVAVATTRRRRRWRSVAVATDGRRRR